MLCFDSDNAGQAAIIKAFKQLAKAGVMVRVGALPEGEDPDSLIRAQGVEAFQKIIDEAPEFFDYQIDRRSSGLKSDTLRDKLEFAREIAENIALIDDKMLQDSLINRIAIRLGVGDGEVRNLVADAKRAAERSEKTQKRREAVQARRKDEKAANDPEISGGLDEPPTNLSNRAIRLLCQILLSDPDARREITAKTPPNYLNHIPDTEIIGKVWTAAIDVEKPGSVSTFVGNLRPGEQKALRALIASEIPTGDLSKMGRDCLISLYRQSLKNRINSVRAALKQPKLDAEMVQKRTEQLLDLIKRLNDVPNDEIR